MAANHHKVPDGKKALNLLKKSTRLRPRLAIILGSGFHQAVAEMTIEKEIPYHTIPGFPPVGVAGHSGRLLLGKLAGVEVLVLSGRAHFYEGHSMEEITFPMRTAAAFGIRDVLLTNAAGGIRRGFKPGDFMAITDHINFMGTNPLRGPNPPGLPRFVEMTHTYDVQLTRCITQSAQTCGIKLHKGVYIAVSGPCYETPAEIRAFGKMGADAVGMSTVPEAIVARHHGLRVAGISCITNIAAGLGGGTLSHNEVLETAERVKYSAAGLLQHFCSIYGKTA